MSLTKVGVVKKPVVGFKVIDGGPPLAWTLSIRRISFLR